MDQTAKFENAGLALQAGRTPPRNDGAGRIELVRVFWRRKMLMIGTMALVTGVAVLTAFQITPRYTAVSRLMIHPDTPMNNIGAVQRTYGGNSRSSLYGEIEVMQSYRLIEKVVLQLGLQEDSEFNVALQSSALSSFAESDLAAWILNLFGPIEEIETTTRETLSSFAVSDLVARILDLFGPTKEIETPTRENSSLELRRVIEKFRAHLVVRPPGLSNTVRVEFESEDAERSARVANTFTHAYISDRLERRFQANLRARQWLDERLSEQRATMIDSERAVADFQASRKLSNSGRMTLADQAITEISRQLIQAKADFAEKKARLKQVLKTRDTAQGLRSVKEVRNSIIIQRLRDQRVLLIRRAAELETRFGERHPKMINIRAEIDNTRDRMKIEERRIVDELRSEVRVAEARVNARTDELEELDRSRAEGNEDEVRLHRLQREAAADRGLYETFLARIRQTEQQETLSNSQVEIIEPARVPLTPSYPHKGLIVGIGLMISIAIGCFVVLIFERLDNGFRTKAQVERIMNSVTLSTIPRQAGTRRRGRTISELVVQDPSAPYAEAIRSLRTSLMVSNIDRPPRTILFASALSGEGKTSVACSLARLASCSALQGRVILIDCDLRRPSVAHEIGIEPDKGLIHYFAGRAKLDEIIVTDPKSGLQMILAAPGTLNPPELLNSTHMRSLLDELARTYDTIVLDSPALSEVSDALVLAHLADATVFVIQWETTPRQVALESYRLLMSASARIAGIVLQKVDMRRTAGYAYGEASV